MCQFLSAIGADDPRRVEGWRRLPELASAAVAHGRSRMVVPIFTKLPAADVGMACSCVADWRDDRARADADQPASSVAVVSCGPLS
jgi:hypothetical protein